MAYNVHEFKSGNKLYAVQLNEMDEQIAANAESVDSLSEEKADKACKKNVSVEITADDIVENVLIDNTGDVLYTDTWNGTKMIALPFDVGVPITVRCAIYGNASLVFLDADKKVIDYINGTNASIYGIEPSLKMQTIMVTPPEGASYIRMSACKGTGGNYVGPSDFALNGQVTVDIIETIEKLDKRTAILDTQTKTESVDITELDIIENALISGNPSVGEGDVVETEAWVCTKPIPLVFDDGTPITLRCAIYGYAAVGFYNVNGNYVGGVTNYNAADYGITPNAAMQEISVIPPTGAAFVRMCAMKNTYTQPSDFAVSGQVTSNIGTDSKKNTKHIAANSTDFRNVKTLVIGDSISTDYYGNYAKWVTHLISIGFFDLRNVNNNSMHATGFVARYGEGGNDFITRIEAVSDPETYDLVVVFGGINDYIQNIPMGESESDKTANFKPAVDYFFQYLVDNFTQARIAVLSPLRTYATFANAVGNKQTDYADYIKSVAKSYCLPVLNLTDESGFCPFIESFNERWTLIPEGYTGHDGVHPTEEYERKYLAPMIRGFLQRIM